jgi:lipid A 3-O-deacylase
MTPHYLRSISSPRLAVIGALALACALPAVAQDTGMGLYVQLGKAPHGGGGDTNAATLGLTGALLPQSEFLGSKLYWDAYVSQWRAPVVGGGSQSITQLGLVPTARWRLDQGRSPWFVDAALGITYLSEDYVTPNKTFGSRWNFTQRLGVGRSFGEQGRHELALSLHHFSNAGIKKPNPGENFLSVRYALKF